MKPKQAHSTKQAIIPSSRWLAYATASATSVFAAVDSAEAAIHYSGKINQEFIIEETATFPLDQPDNFFRVRHHTGTGYAGYNYFTVAGQAGGSIVGFYNDACAGFSPVWASKLQLGQMISRRPFVPAQSALLAIGTGCGEFNHRGLGFIGFKFNNGSGDQYGWVRIFARRTFHDNFILIDYAYGDVGDQIRAGQKSTNQMVPDKGSLGWLALGGAGLLAWRRSRSKSASD